MPITPSPAATATGLCATTQMRPGKLSISIGNVADGFSARWPASCRARVIRWAASLMISPVRWNSWLATLRAGERTLSRFIFTTSEMKLRVPGMAFSTCSRSEARSGLSTVANATSSAPASRQIRRNHSASMMPGFSCGARDRTARTVGWLAIRGGRLSIVMLSIVHNTQLSPTRATGPFCGGRAAAGPARRSRSGCAAPSLRRRRRSGR